MQSQRVAVTTSGGILTFYGLSAAMCGRSAKGCVCFVPLVAYFLLQDELPIQTGKLFSHYLLQSPYLL